MIIAGTLRVGLDDVKANALGKLLGIAVEDNKYQRVVCAIGILFVEISASVICGISQNINKVVIDLCHNLRIRRQKPMQYMAPCAALRTRLDQDALAVSPGNS